MGLHGMHGFHHHAKKMVFTGWTWIKVFGWTMILLTSSRRYHHGLQIHQLKRESILPKWLSTVNPRSLDVKLKLNILTFINGYQQRIIGPQSFTMPLFRVMWILPFSLMQLHDLHKLKTIGKPLLPPLVSHLVQRSGRPTNLHGPSLISQAPPKLKPLLVVTLI